MVDDKLRFKLKKGDLEIELDGEYTYVKSKFEDLLDNFAMNQSQVTMSGESIPRNLENILEQTPDGKLYLVIPADNLTSKEALALFLFAKRPQKYTDKELADMISGGWKTIKAEAIRARASELRRDGKLISENGQYTLSGAGAQWVERDILTKLKTII